MVSRFFMFIACLGLSVMLFAQTGHPAKGSWSGELSSGSEVTRMRLLLNAMNGELSGDINPGRNAVKFNADLAKPDAIRETSRIGSRRLPMASR